MKVFEFERKDGDDGANCFCRSLCSHCYSCGGVEHRNAHEINRPLTEEEVENPCVCTAYCLKVFRL